MHPQRSGNRQVITVKQNIIRPFHYPIFDILRLSDLIVTISSTEGITAAVLDKPIIEYDTSRSPERWPFVPHGVARRATTQRELINCVKDALSGKFKLKPKVNYREEYHVDGNCSERTAKAIIQHFAHR